jgi:uncharacterized protein (TIGR02996 family)
VNLPPDAEAFLAAVAESPEDAERRLVFADWLEEHGLPGAARAQRWLAAGNKPRRDPDYRSYHAETGQTWWWFVRDEATIEFWASFRLNPEREGLLPDRPVLVLRGECHKNSYVRAGYWRFGSRDEAERALMEAWPDDPDG